MFRVDSPAVCRVIVSHRRKQCQLHGTEGNSHEDEQPEAVLSQPVLDDSHRRRRIGDALIVCNAHLGP